MLNEMYIKNAKIAMKCMEKVVEMYEELPNHHIEPDTFHASTFLSNSSTRLHMNMKSREGSITDGAGYTLMKFALEESVVGMGGIENVTGIHRGDMMFISTDAAPGVRRGFYLQGSPYPALNDIEDLESYIFQMNTDDEFPMDLIQVYYLENIITPNLHPTYYYGFHRNILEIDYLGLILKDMESIHINTVLKDFKKIIKDE